jgi:hypothetical protein
MKKKTFILLITLTMSFLFFNSLTNAQVTFEQSYLTSTLGSLGEDFFLTNLGNDNYKYVIYNYRYNYFSMYNLNHTPFILNIPTNVVNDSANFVYYRLGYITTTLFDCDSTNIEYAMMLDLPNASVHPNFAVYRTDGTLLFSKDTVGTFFCVGCGSGSWEMHPIMNTPAGAKIFLFNNPTSTLQQALIYAVCGTVPETITEINQSDSYVKVFPNPSSKQITFQIIPPSHMEKYELTIFNSAFQEVKRTEIIGGESTFDLESKSLSSGTYFYSLQNKAKIFQTGKFVIAK